MTFENNNYIKVNDIRPNDLALLMEKAQKTDNQWLERQREYFVEGICPLCAKSASSHFAYRLKNGLVYNRCDKCATLFLSMRPSEEAYKKFYKISSTMRLFASHIFPQSQENRIKHIYIPRIERILSMIGNNINEFLEIGAGSGVFSELVKKRNIFSKIICIEPNPELARSCREKNIDVVIEDAVENIYDSKLFINVSLACCFEVLEHLYNPFEFIKKVYSLLPDEGIFCLTTPNGMGIDILELGSESTTLGLTHINIFNPNSILSLLTESGFKIMNISTPGKLDVDLLTEGYIKNDMNIYDGWLQNIALGENNDLKLLLQDFIIKNNQSSHMWAICQK